MDSNLGFSASKLVVSDLDHSDSPKLESTSECTFKRIPELYFPDGSIILEAETTHFRVHGSILAARSPVFMDVLSLPHSSQDGSKVNDKVDGCDVIHLAGDDAEEVACFLRAIFDSSFFEPPPTPTTINVVIAILRLSTKYDVSYLRRRALNHLDTLYPLTLAAFDERQNFRTMPKRLNTAFYVASLAHQLGLTWLLPPTLYCVCAGSHKDIIEGAVWEGETRVHLDTVDKVRCVGALVELGNREKRDVLSFLTVNVVEGCRTPDECRMGRVDMLRALDSGRRRVDPLGVFPGPEGKRWKKYEMCVCKVCEREGKKVHREGKKKLWDALPEIFGLEDWEVLCQLRLKALHDVE